LYRLAISAAPAGDFRRDCAPFRFAVCALIVTGVAACPWILR